MTSCWNKLVTRLLSSSSLYIVVQKQPSFTDFLWLKINTFRFQHSISLHFQNVIFLKVAVAVAPRHARIPHSGGGPGLRPAIDLYKNDVKCGKFMLHEI